METKRHQMITCPPVHSIMGNMTLFSDQDPEVLYPSQDVVWERFEQAFAALWGLVTYAPVFRDYYYQGLTQFYTDNVMYLELRALLPQVLQSPAAVTRPWNVSQAVNKCCFFVCFCHPDVRVGRQHSRHSLDSEDLPGGHQAVHGGPPGLLRSEDHLHHPKVTTFTIGASE